MLIGAIANAGLPPFAGFFSKDSIIEAVHAWPTCPAPASPTSAPWPAVFVGGLYSFRLIFFTFHGKERFRKARTMRPRRMTPITTRHDDHGHHGPASRTNRPGS
jgi:NADH-quinone oxidoreductase subunit L